MKNINDLLKHLNLLNNKPAMIYNKTTYYYYDLYQFCISISNWILIKKYNSIMFSLKNSHLTVALYLSAWKSNAHCFPINPRLTTNELIEIIEDSKKKPSTLMIENEQNSVKIEQYCKKNNIVLYIITDVGFFVTSIVKKFLNVSIIPKTFKRIGVTYHITSGTNGKYKRFGHSIDQILRYANDRIHDLGFLHTDMPLITLSMNHAYSFSYQLLPSLFMGLTIFILPEFCEDIVIDVINNYPITNLALLPSMYYLLCTKKKELDFTNLNLRYLSVAGDQPSKYLNRLVKETFKIPLLNGIGMTEIYGYAQNIAAEKKHNRIKIFNEVDVKIIPIKKTISKKNARKNSINLKNKKIDIGEIYLKSYMLPFKHDLEWLPTGDLGYIDGNQYLYYFGRIKDIIIKGGSNISPLELEYYILDIPEIKEIAIVGKKDSVWGELVCACVVTNHEERVTANFINQYLLKYIADYKKIDKIYFFNNLPKNITGKINRSYLKLKVNE